MILVVSLLEQERSLYEYEFVEPVEKAVRSAKVETQRIHYHNMTSKKAETADAIILCGTAFGDNHILQEIEQFHWLKTYTGRALGICVGADILSIIHGGSVEEKEEIGAYKLKQLVDDPVLGDMDGKEVYELHKLAPTLPRGFVLLAETENCVQAFRSGDGKSYGVLFHPEVRQGGIIERFCNISQ